MWLDVTASCLTTPLINVFTTNSHSATKLLFFFVFVSSLPPALNPRIYLPHPHTKWCFIFVLASWSRKKNSPKENHFQFVGVVQIRSWTELFLSRILILILSLFMERIFLLHAHSLYVTALVWGLTLRLFVLSDWQGQAVELWPLLR